MNQSEPTPTISYNANIYKQFTPLFDGTLSSDFNIRSLWAPWINKIRSITWAGSAQRASETAPRRALLVCVICM